MKNISIRQVTLTLLTTTALITASASAAEFTVSTPTTVQNGGAGNIIDGGDSLTIETGGSITQNTFPAIFGTGSLNTITNAGSITTTGNGNIGIFIPDQNTIVNSGTITTDGDFAHAVLVQDNNTVRNSGEIVVKSTNSIGIIGQTGNTMTNSGTITTLSSFSTGMAGLNNNTITNSGTVSISGENAIGISLLGINNTALNSGTINVNGLNTFGMAATGINNTITNSGSIIHNNVGVAMGAWPGGNNLVLNNSGTIITNGEAHGILALNDSTISNTGSILTKGTQGQGIIAGIGNTITNSGKIIAEQTDAILFTGSDNQLTLNAPSFIGGRINMGNTNAVDITTGRSHSVLWDFSTHGANFNSSFSGPVPWAWNPATEQFSTLDPTALSAAPDMLADKVNSLSSLTRTNGALDNNEWWIKGFGNFSNYGAQGVFNDYTVSNGGIAAGGAFVLNDNMSLGAMIGYQATRLNVNSTWMQSQNIEGNGLVGSVSANMSMDDFFAGFTLFGGAQQNTSSRLVNDNLANLGVSYADGSYGSWFIAPELRLGLDIETDGAWTITPSATARYSLQQNAGYTETGANANATFGARSVRVFEGNLELAATRQIDQGSITVLGGVQYRQNFGGATSDITLLGQTLSMPVATDGSLFGYVGASASFDVGEMNALDLSANLATNGNGFYSVSGAIGFKSEF